MNHLTKSNFLIGMECPMKLWYSVNPPDKPVPSYPEDEYRMLTGREVGRMAWGLFPEGKCPEYCGQNIENQLKATAELTSNEDIPAIYEGTFFFDGILIRADILARDINGRWSLFEVKSSTVISRERHLWDVWIQYYVLSRLGFELNKAGILHLNKDYIYYGNSHDFNKLFVFYDFKPQIDPLNVLLGPAIDWFKDIMQGPQPELPELDRQCKECPFRQICRNDIPEDWIAYLPNLHQSKWDSLSSLGIKRIYDIPEKIDLSQSQKIVKECTVSGNDYVNPELTGDLREIDYPLFFIDFESASTAIPWLDGTKPYQQIPFQWSCHIMDSEGKVEHRQFISDTAEDPRAQFTRTLIDCLGSKGTIIHYTPFEKTILKDMASVYPDYSEKVGALFPRMIDLCKLLKGNYYHPDFRGSYSIKRVLPVLFPNPDAGWKNLEIQDGISAMLNYFKMIDPDMPGDDKRKIREDLLSYCCQDTHAMVQIYEFLIDKSDSIS